MESSGQTRPQYSAVLIRMVCRVADMETWIAEIDGERRYITVPA